MTDELTGQDKVRLLAVTDGKAARDGEYDRAFYEAMYRTRPLGLEELDDRVRQAILRYIADGKNEESKEYGGYIMMGFAHGYMVGRKLRKDIRKDTGDNQRMVKTG
jgi:hypothetical protein